MNGPGAGLAPETLQSDPGRVAGLEKIQKNPPAGQVTNRGVGQLVEPFNGFHYFLSVSVSSFFASVAAWAFASASSSRTAFASATADLERIIFVSISDHLSSAI